MGEHLAARRSGSRGPPTPATSSASRRYSTTSSAPIGWVFVSSQSVAGSTGEALDDPAQQLVGLAARPDHHRGAEVGERRALGGERPGDVVARRRGACERRLVAEPAEVDHPLDAGRPGGAREARRGRALDRRVVLAVADHVDEEVGGLRRPPAPAARPCGRVEVGDRELAAALASSSAAAERGSRTRQRTSKPSSSSRRASRAADEAGRAGDQDSPRGHRAVVPRTPTAKRSRPRARSPRRARRPATAAGRAARASAGSALQTSTWMRSWVWP